MLTQVKEHLLDMPLGRSLSLSQPHRKAWYTDCKVHASVDTCMDLDNHQ